MQILASYLLPTSVAGGLDQIHGMKARGHEAKGQGQPAYQLVLKMVLAGAKWHEAQVA